MSLKDSHEALSADEVEQDLKRRWPKVVCRFPAVKQGRLDRENPLATYVFVQLPVSRKVEQSVYVQRLLRDPATRRVQRVTDAELHAMLPVPELPAPGSRVQITNGDWAGLVGIVVESSGSGISALVELWSRKRLVELEASEFQCVDSY